LRIHLANLPRAEILVSEHQDGSKWRILHFAQLFLWKLMPGVRIDLGVAEHSL
jgi:hypothetical protein